MVTAVIVIIAFVIARIILKKTDKNPPSKDFNSNQPDTIKPTHSYNSSVYDPSHRSSDSSSYPQYQAHMSQEPLPDKIQINGVVYRDVEVIQAILTYIQSGRVLDKLPDEIMFVPDEILDGVLNNHDSTEQRVGWHSDYKKSTPPSTYPQASQSATPSVATKRDVKQESVTVPKSPSPLHHEDINYQTQYQSQYKSQYGDHHEKDD